MPHCSQDLEVHVQDVTAALESDDLRDVVLVGHSYAGFVISVVAERARVRLRQLVYPDAFVPEPTGHDAMITAPEALARLLLDIA